MANQASGLEELTRQLIERQAESRSLDYKAAMAFGPANAEKGEILKCIMAFANTRDGGFMLIGVDQAGGKFTPSGVTPVQAASFDVTKVGNFAANYCSVQPRVEVNVVDVDGMDLLLLRISEFEDEPIVCTKDLHDSSGKKLVLRAGSIYIRTPDARCVAIESGEAMRAFLDLAVQKRGDALLQQIRRLVGPAEPVSVEDSLGEYRAELDAANGLFDDEDITEPYWHVEVFPAAYEAERVNTMARLREIRREAAVSIRGWDFPHIDREQDRPFENGIESITHWTRYNEAHRIYRSGLFTWRRQLAEDSSEQYQGSVSYVSSIYSLTEHLLFATRYLPLILDEGDVVVRVGMRGIRDRVLRSEQPGMWLNERPTAAQNFERAYRLPIEELRATHLDLAAEAGRQLFDLFDEDIGTDAIKDWQTRFIERRF